MESLKKKAVLNAVAMLKAAGAEYKIIFEGELFGQQHVGARQEKRRPRVHMVKDQLDRMQVGDYCKIDLPEGESVDRLQQAVCNYAGKVWGPGTYMTSRDSSGAVEVIRKA